MRRRGLRMLALAACLTAFASSSQAADSPDGSGEPKMRPRSKGFVLDAHVGALGFLGSFRRLATTAPWLHVQFGYEPFRWLLLFGEGELAFTDTTVGQDASKVRAFPIFGFGAGARATWHVTERVGLFAQPSLGAMKADVPDQALAIVGFRNAESLQPYFGGRIGVEWYQMNRHLALSVMGGARSASGFARDGKNNDGPYLWDASGGLRYTF